MTKHLLNRFVFELNLNKRCLISFVLTVIHMSVRQYLFLHKGHPVLIDSNNSPHNTRSQLSFDDLCFLLSAEDIELSRLLRHSSTKARTVSYFDFIPFTKRQTAFFSLIFLVRLFTLAICCNPETWLPTRFFSTPSSRP